MRLSTSKHPLSLFVLALLATATLAGCGSVSKMTREQASAPVQIADFSRVEVLDFTSSDATVFEDQDRAAKHAIGLAAAQRDFADKLAEEIRATGAFAEVSRGPGPRPALRISGDISRYDEGNIVARGLTGFAGQTHFDARIDVADADSGHQLTSVTVDRNSWPLPVGASMSTLQTTNYFMNNAAKKLAEALAAKKGVVVPKPQ